MLCVSVIAVLETYKVFLIECLPDVETSVAIQMKNSRRILDDQHKLCFALVQQIIGQTFLISFIKRILCIGAEFTIVWWIKKDEISSFRRMFLKERFKVHVLYHSISKVPLQLRGSHIGNLSCQIFSVIRDATVGNVELTPPVISEHRSIGILSHKKEDSCRRA